MFIEYRLNDEVREDVRTPGLFIRPNSNKKEFAGQVFKDEQEFRILVKDILNLPLDTLCFVNRVNKPKAEIRCWIVNNQVELAVGYDGLDFIGSLSESVFNDIIREVNRFCWGLHRNDNCFVMDVGLDDGFIPSIIELNSFCCSGFYDADTTHLVNAIAQQAIKDYS